MDLDKSLDETIAEQRSSKDNRPAFMKRKSAGGGGAAVGGDREGAGGGARQAARTRAPEPYARPPPKSTDDKWERDLFPSNNRSARPTNFGAASRGVNPRIIPGTQTRLLISGIHYELTESELDSIFSKAGNYAKPPKIIFDRSGRSTGVATVQYETHQMAKNAINMIDGNTAKGSVIHLKFHDIQPKPIESMTPAGSDLLGRIEGGSKMRSDSIPANATRGAGAGGRGGSAGFGGGVGPVRSARGAPNSGRSTPTQQRSSAPRSDRERDAGNTRGGGRGGRSGGGGGEGRKKAVTAEDLDAELASYHAPAPAAAAPAVQADGDVEMS